MPSHAATEGPRSFTITPDDQGGVIVVVGCILMTWTLLCFMIRLYNRFMLRSSLGLDDFACGLATVSTVIPNLLSTINLIPVRSLGLHRRWYRVSQYLMALASRFRWYR